MIRKIRVIDSHTCGEPTRVVLEGGPELGSGTLAERRDRFRADYDCYRSAIINEPRGSDAMVGALLCPSTIATCVTGVIFFNNVGTLGMCGHGTIGLVVTLAHLGHLGPGTHDIETPVGMVTSELHDDGRVTVSNVPSYRWAAGVSINVPGHGRVVGDVAWGGNWFFLVREHGKVLSITEVATLIDFSWDVRQALHAAGITGGGGAEIDHVELFSPSPTPGLDSRNFVLCPGRAYDRSPCGTGTSAKLACLAADGVLRPGDVWRQESIIGTVFEGRFDVEPDNPNRVLPHITSTAHVTAEATLLVDESDPLGWGIR